MYNVLNKLTCVAGERNRAAAIITEGSQKMPGCSFYSVSLDRTDESSIWVFEVWASERHHADSLKLESVQRAMTAARGLITGAHNVFSADVFAMNGGEG